MNLWNFIRMLLLIAQAVWRPHTVSTAFDTPCYDFETARIVQIDPYINGCALRDWDISFGYNSLKSVKTVVVPNIYNGTFIAYSSLPFEQVNRASITGLVFQKAIIDVPFTSVAVIQTSNGNFFKVQLIEESTKRVVFRWQRLW